jgi:glycosyltransferase involved in cell wall biosynthesis
MDGTGSLRDEAEGLGLGEIPDYPLTRFYNRNAVVQLRRFAVLLREREIAVLHTHDFYSNLFGIVGATLAGVPVRIASRRELGFRPAVKRRVERLAYRLAHGVVANSEAVRQQLIREGVRADRIVVIHNGIDLAHVTAKPGSRRGDSLSGLGLPAVPERRFVTIVANLHAVKDHRTFLQSARRVRAAVPEAAFILAGEGEMEAPLRALAGELGLGNEAFFLGRCERIAELLAISDVCVLSSASEGFSNAILEYMAAARPDVATDVGGAREAVVEGETGYLVPAGDDEAMAARIVSLLRDPERARGRGARGGRVGEQRFSPAAPLASPVGLYDGLLAWTAARRRPASGGYAATEKVSTHES